MRKVWMDFAGSDPQDCSNKLATYQSWFASPVLDLQADLYAHVRNAGCSSAATSLFVPLKLNFLKVNFLRMYLNVVYLN